MKYILPTTGRLLLVLPISTSMRNTRAMRKRKDVSSAKMRRVRVAALMV